MTLDNQPTRQSQSSRRSILKAGGAATVASILGFSGSAVAQEGDGNQGGMSAWMFNDEARPGAVFRVKSLPLDDRPSIDESASGALPENPTTRVVEYFNTNEEVLLILPSEAGVETGELYQLTEDLQFVDGAGSEGLVEVQFQPVDADEFTFDLADSDEIELVEGGGEGAVRPRNFSPSSIFRVVSGPQGWVPRDVEESGFFTDYNTHHAEYLGADDEFLFFPQEDADVEEGGLYTVQEEWEMFDPVGNLVAVEFSRVNEDSIPVDDEYL